MPCYCAETAIRVIEGPGSCLDICDKCKDNVIRSLRMLRDIKPQLDNIIEEVAGKAQENVIKVSEAMNHEMQKRQLWGMVESRDKRIRELELQLGNAKAELADARRRFVQGSK